MTLARDPILNKRAPSAWAIGLLGVSVGLMAPPGIVLQCKENAAALPGDRARFEMDNHYLGSKYWEDGNAEIAFFRIWDRRKAFETLAGAILVRHHLLPNGDLKVPSSHKGALASFTQIWIYEEPCGSEGPRRHYREIDMRQADLRALSATSSLSTWSGQCSYRATVDMSADRISERATSCRTLLPTMGAGTSHSFGPGVFLPGQVPLAIRALDFSSRTSHVLLIYFEGKLIEAMAQAVGLEEVMIGDRRVESLRIDVAYSQALDSPEAASPVSVLGDVGTHEIYWRSENEHRQILRMQGDQYGMELIEEVRAKHWSEDFYPDLNQVRDYP